jgi:hypothetical protein
MVALTVSLMVVQKGFPMVDSMVSLMVAQTAPLMVAQTVEQ